MSRKHPSRRTYSPVELALLAIGRKLDKLQRLTSVLLIYLLEGVANKNDIRNIMSLISEHNAVVVAQYARINSSLDNITSDIAGVKAKLEQMNNNPGAISAEDQQLLTDSIAALTAIGDRAEALAASTEDAPTVPV